MTYDLAVRILDRVRDGIFYPAEIIHQALVLTGDARSEDRPEPWGNRVGTQECWRDRPEPRSGWERRP